jgi:hypothetical protein
MCTIRDIRQWGSLLNNFEPLVRLHDSFHTNNTLIRIEKKIVIVYEIESFRTTLTT